MDLKARYVDTTKEFYCISIGKHGCRGMNKMANWIKDATN